jgi:hypothetical protein
MLPHERKTGEMEQLPSTRQTWEPMALSYLGSVGEILQNGGGKLSPSPNDPGDVFKPRGQDPH